MSGQVANRQGAASGVGVDRDFVVGIRSDGCGAVCRVRGSDRAWDAPRSPMWGPRWTVEPLLTALLPQGGGTGPYVGWRRSRGGKKGTLMESERDRELDALAALQDRA